MNLNLTLIGQSLTFIAFIWFCLKFVWPVLLATMQEREKRIEEGLRAADRADKDLELAQKEASNKLKEAKKEASTIVEQANRRATKIIEDAKKQAQEDAERIKHSAQVEVDQQIARAREELRGKVAHLSLTGAEKILEKSIDKTAHDAMLKKLADEL